MNCFIKKLVIFICLIGFVGVGFAINADEIGKITAAAPDKASVQPKQPRKILVFSLCQGYKHSSIPYCGKAIEILGSKTGAFTCDDTIDKSVFTAENLKQYDAIVFNNTTKLTFDESQRKAIMDFVKGGKGIVGIHAATDNFYDWPEAAEMMGGVFSGHPWGAGGTWAIKIEDPTHPVALGFDGKNFSISDEIYRTKQMNLRKNARVLVGLDMSAEVNLKAGGVREDDVDIPISWVRDFGKGRVFYCGFGHNHPIFWTPTILKHYLDGIQFALGDLKIDTTPVPLKKNFGDIKKMLDATAGFKYGQSRASLIAIENAIDDAVDFPDRLSEIATAMEHFLVTDATIACKQFICTQLSFISKGEAVGVLSQMLTKEDTSDMARIALERIAGSMVDGLLVNSLGRTKGHVKIGIVNSLGVRKSSCAVNAIAPLALSSDKLLAGASIEALSRIATADAADALEAALKKNNSSQKAVIEDALLSCGDALAANGDNDEALSVYKKLNGDTETNAIKVASFMGMIKTSGSKSADLIVSAIKSDDSAVRSQAISMIGVIDSKRGLKKVFRTIGNLAPKDQAQLLLNAGEIDSSVTVDAIFEYVKSSDEQVRIAAISSMKSIGKVDAVKVLSEIASTTKSTEQNAARASLYGLTGSGVDYEVLKLIGRSKDTKVLTELVMAVGQRGIDGSTDVLVKQAKASDTNLSRQSYRSLAVVAEGKDLSKAIALLVNLENESVRGDAEKTVTVIATSNKASVRPILSAIEATNDAKVKTSLMSVLGKTASPEALGALLKALGDSDDDVKTAAIRGLSQWADGSVAIDLMEASKSSRNKIHKVLAFRGFVRAIPLKSSRTVDHNVALFKQAISLASDTAEKRLVLSSLSNMPNTQTLELALSCVGDAALKSEVSTTVTQMLKGMDMAASTEILPLLIKAKSSVTDEASVNKIQDAINYLERLDGFITKWQISGPYLDKKEDLFSKAYAPEDTASADVKWETVSVGGNGVLNLGSLMGGDNRVAYLKTTVISDKAREARLEIGSDDGVKVFVNGKVVYGNDTTRPCTPNQDKVKITLDEGENVVLMKIIQIGGNWEACLRVRDADGSKADGVKVKSIRI